MKNLFLMFIIVTLFGCVPQYSKPAYNHKKIYLHSTDENSKYEDKNIIVYINPKKGYLGAYKSININIENKTNDDIKIVWNESYFLNNGIADGGFMFEGIKYSERDSEKRDMLILPKTKTYKEVWPTSKVMYGPMSGYINALLDDGNYGVYIMIKGKKFEKRVKLTFNISSTYN